MSTLADNAILLKILKMLVTPFDKTDAFKLGIIDADGNKLRSPKTKEEDGAYSYLNRFIFNLKKIINRRNPKATKDIAHAMFLVKESNILEEAMVSDIDENEIEELLFVLEESDLDLSKLEEEISGVGIVANAPKDTPMKLKDLKGKILKRKEIKQ